MAKGHNNKGAHNKSRLQRENATQYKTTGLPFIVELGDASHKELSRQLFENGSKIGLYFADTLNIEYSHTTDAGLMFVGHEDTLELTKETFAILAKKVKAGEKLDKNMIQTSMVQAKKAIVNEVDFHAANENLQQPVAKPHVHFDLGIKVHFEAQTKGQGIFYKLMEENKATIGVGVAGTGKTRVAVAKALDDLQAKRVKKIYMTRAAVASEDLGYLPGTKDEKLGPYIEQILDEVREILGGDLEAERRIEELFRTKKFEIVPVAFMRGRNVKDTFLIVDEAQNCTYKQLKTIHTRFKGDTKIVYTGDPGQVDLPNPEMSGLKDFALALTEYGVKDIGFHYFDASEVVRDEMVKESVMAFEAFEAKKLAELDKREKKMDKEERKEFSAFKRQFITHTIKDFESAIQQAEEKRVKNQPANNTPSPK